MPCVISLDWIIMLQARRTFKWGIKGEMCRHSAHYHTSPVTAPLPSPPPTLTIALPEAVRVVGARKSQLGEAPPSSTNSRPKMNLLPELI